MMRPTVGAAILLTGCVTAEGVDQDAQIRLLAMDLQEALSVAMPLIDEENHPWVMAVQTVLGNVAMRDPGEPIDWPVLFDAVRDLQPMAEQALRDQGLDEIEAAAVISMSNIIMRRLELSLTGEVPMPAPAPTR